MINTKKIISYILSIIITILMIAIIILGNISSSFFNKANMKKTFTKSDYYYNIYDIVLENMKNDIMPSGFDEKIFEGIITEEKVKNDINQMLEDIYDNKKIEISTDEMRKKLNENIQKQIKEKEYIVTEENKKEIDEVENSIINMYKEHICYSEDVINQIKDYINKMKIVVKILIIVLSIITIALAIIAFVLNKSSIGIALMMAGVFFTFVNIYSGTALVINNIMIFNWAFSKTITFILNQLFEGLLTIGAILIIIGFAEIIITEYLMNLVNLGTLQKNSTSKI